MTGQTAGQHLRLESADETVPESPGITILSDLSANIFAALLIILILLLQVKVAQSSHREAPSQTAVDAVSDLGAITHHAMTPSSTITFLKDRGPDTPGVRLDVTREGVFLAQSGAGGSEETRIAGADLGARLDRRLLRTPSVPIRLYIFSNRWYQTVRRQLERAQVEWQEISVPAALRSVDDGSEWSPAFRRLVAARISLPAFRLDLARLLAGSNRLSPNSRAISRQASSLAADAAVTGQVSYLAALWHVLSVVLGIGALVIATVVVIGLEVIVPMSSSRY